MLIAVWHLQPYYKRDFMGKFSASGTKVETIKLRFASRCQWTHGNLPVRDTGMIVWQWGPPVRKMVI